jgi:predicted membrane metal-binding protein
VFDYRSYLDRHDPKAAPHYGFGSGIWHGLDRLKNWTQARLEAPFALRPDIGGLVLGMVLGRKYGLTSEIERQFQAGGLYHLVVVSGFNLAVIAGTAMWLARLLPWKRRTRLFFVLACSLAYAG